MNHAADPHDIGTVWFDDSDAEVRVVAFLDSRLRPDDGRRTPTVDAEEDEEEDEEKGQHRRRKGGSAKPLSSVGLDKATTSFLDLGCGNGSLLFALRDAGWRGRMAGVDYSPGSVELARRVARWRMKSRRGSADGAAAEGDDDADGEGEDGTAQELIRVETVHLGEGEEKNTKKDDDGDAGSTSPLVAPDVNFMVWDVLNGPLDTVLDPLAERSFSSSSDPSFMHPSSSAAEIPGFTGATRGWDVVLDKGTFDAMSLSADTDAQGRPVYESYRGRVLACLRPGGLFVVTSCNWTEAELGRWFATGSRESGAEATDMSSKLETAAAGTGGWFEQAGRVEYRSFNFGGVKGQTVSTVCFVKRAG